MENTVYREYSRIIEESEKWFRFSDRVFMEQLNIDTLFERVNSKNFVRLMFFHENLVQLIPKVKFPKKREFHTVSAFMLGILLKDKLKMSTRSLPDPCKNHKKSFIYFWSMICLSHDLTFWLESNEEYLIKCNTIEKFYQEFNIKYRLIDESCFGQLFRDYYRYNIEQRGLIDHGITCGIILYDQLIKLYVESTNRGGIILTNDQWKYNKKFKEYALRISETIARHNIWVADPENEKIYRDYNLHKLISSDPDFNKVKYSEQDSMLFLLGLVDTLEPIKCCTRNKEEYDVYDILKNIKIECNSRKKSIHIYSEVYINSEITDSWRSLEKWLNLTVEVANDNEVKISFEYEKETEEFKILVA